MKVVEVRAQAELDAAISAGHIADLVSGIFRMVTYGTAAPHVIVRAGVQLEVVARGSSQPRVEAWESSQPRVMAWESSQPRVEARGSSQPRVEAWESSQPRVEARGSSQPRVVARGSSQPRVEAWGSSQPRVMAWESSQPRVEAWESSQPRVEAWESSQPRVVAWGLVQLSLLGRIIAKVSAKVAVLIQGPAEVEGGQQTRLEIATPRDWCEHYGVRVEEGVATVFKALNDDFTSPKGGHYDSGSVPAAPDWDGGREECGGGLHFSPSPSSARSFHPDAKRYVACPVALSDMRAPKHGDQFPHKIKASRCCGPVFECDEDGERVETSVAVSDAMRREAR